MKAGRAATLILAVGALVIPGSAGAGADKIESSIPATSCLEEMKMDRIDSGRPVTVLRRDGSTFEGSIRSVEATRLRLRLKPSGYARPSGYAWDAPEIEVAAEEVAGVSYWSRGERDKKREKRNATIGALAGGVLGYLIGYYIMANPGETPDPHDFFHTDPKDVRHGTGIATAFLFMTIGHFAGREIGAKPSVLRELSCAPIPAAQVGSEPTEFSPAAAHKTLPRWHAFRPHPGPRSQCGTFVLTELAMLRRLGGGDDIKSGERIYGSFDAGLEHNVSDAAALGGSVFFGLDEHRYQFGVRLRARRWLSEKASLDLAPGLILAGKEEKNAEFLGPALVLRASLNLSPSFGVTIQKFETRRPNRFVGVVKERATYVGAQLNSNAGSVGLRVVCWVAAFGTLLALSGL